MENRNFMKAVPLVAVLGLFAVVGCNGPEADPNAFNPPTRKKLPDLPPAAAEAGLKVDPSDPGLMAQAQTMAFTSRANPFALLPTEIRFDKAQLAASLNDTMGFYPLFGESEPLPVQPPFRYVEEPDRRLAGGNEDHRFGASPLGGNRDKGHRVDPRRRARARGTGTAQGSGGPFGTRPRSVRPDRGDRRRSGADDRCRHPVAPAALNSAEFQRDRDRGWNDHGRSAKPVSRSDPGHADRRRPGKCAAAAQRRRAGFRCRHDPSRRSTGTLTAGYDCQ